MGFPLKGRKGSSGTSRKATRHDDTLFGQDTVEALLALGEGPIKGWVNGASDVFVGDVPLLDKGTKTPNISNFELRLLKGTNPADSIKLNLGGQASTVNVGLELRVQDQKIVAAGNKTQIDYLDVRFVVNQLLEVTEEGGEFPTDLNILIEVKPRSASVWQIPFQNEDPPPDTEDGSGGSYRPNGTEPGTLINDAYRETYLSPTRPAKALVKGAMWFKTSDTYWTPLIWDGAAFQIPANRTRSTRNGYQIWTWNDYDGALRTAWFAPNGIAPPPDTLARGDYLLTPAAGAEVYSYNDTSWVDFQSWAQPARAAPGVVRIYGLSRSSYPKEYRIPVARINEPYDVRVTRLSPISDPKKYLRNITFESIQEVNGSTVSFPDLALMWLTIKATDTFTSIPEFTSIARGIMIPVPSNAVWDEANKITTFPGIWDGTFKIDYTNSPAWHAYNLIMNSRYGKNAYFPEVADKYDYYEFGKHCTAHKLRFNEYITEARPLNELINYVVGIAGGRYVDRGDGYSTVLWDADDQPALALFTQENVQDGIFTYSWTDVTERKNDLKVSFKNPELNYREDRVRVYDPNSISVDGRNAEEFVAVGCRDAEEAVRRGRFRLATGLTEKTIVNFKTNRQGRYLQPFQVFLVADPEATSVITGRVLNPDTLPAGSVTLPLRDQIYLEAGIDYSVTFTQSNGNGGLKTVSYPITVTTPGQTSVLKLGRALSEPLMEYAVFSIGTPKAYRLTGLTPDDSNPDLIDITGMEVNRQKWAYVDGLVTLRDILSLQTGPLSKFVYPVSGATITPQSVVKSRVAVLNLLLQWNASETKLNRGYRIYHGMNGETMSLLYEGSALNFAHNRVENGLHTYSIVAVGLDNTTESPPVTLQYSVVGSLRSVKPATNLRLVNETNAPIFGARDPLFTWDASPDPLVGRYRVDVLNATNTVVHTEFVDSTSLTFMYSLAANMADNGGTPLRVFTVRVFAVDTKSNVSVPVALVVSRPAPPAVVPALSTTGTSVVVAYQATVPDIQGAIIWMEQNNTYDPLNTTAKYDGTFNPVFIPSERDKDYWVRMALYDSYGKSGLNISAAVKISTSGLLFDPNAPDIPVAPALTTTLVKGADGKVSANVRATWAASPSTNFGSFELQVRLTAGGDWLPMPMGANLAATISNLPPATVFQAQLRAINVDGYAKSGWSPTAQITTAANTAAPGLATAFTVSGTFQSAYGSWTNPADVDQGGTDVFAGTTNVFTAATKLLTVPGKGTSFIDPTLGVTATKFYWVRPFNTSGVTSTSPTGPVQATSAAITGAQLAAGVIDATKFATSIKPVELFATLPTTGNVDGRQVFNTTDKKLYRYDAAQGKFVSTVSATDVAGQLTDAQLEKISATKLIGQVVSTQLADASITMEKMFAGLSPIGTVSALPAVAGYTGPKVVLLSTDGKLYRLIGSAWVNQTPAADIAGTLTDAQVAGLTASKLIGPIDKDRITAVLANVVLPGLTDAQITGLSAAKVAGALTNATMPAGSISGTIASGQIASLTASQITGQMSDAQLAGISAAKLAGTLTDAQLSGISAAKLIGPVVGAQLADNAINLSKIATGLSLLGEVTTLPAVSGYTGPKTVLNLTDGRVYRLVSGAWTSAVTAAEISGQLAAGQIAAITAGQITGALTSAQIGDLDAAKLTGTIAPVRIPALPATAVTGALTSAQIGDLDAAKLTGTIAPVRIPQLPATAITGTLTSAQIAGLDAAKLTSQIVSTQITDSAITTAKVAAGAITAASIAAGSITASKLMIASQNRAYNADLSQNLLGIALGSSSMGITVDLLYRAATDYSPDGQPSFYMRGSGTPNAGTAQQILLKNVPAADGAVANYAVTAGQIYEFSVAIAALRCSVTVNILWYNAAGAGLGSSGPNNTISVAQQVGSVVTFPRAWTLGVAPAGAVSAVLLVRAVADGGANPSLFGSCLMFASALVGQTEPSPYVDPGVTVIDGSSIRTGSLSADRIIANSITAGQIATNAITADAILANSIVAGKIATDAVTADKILANSIVAGKIATDAVTAGTIAAGSIIAGKIAANAVTATTIAADSITAIKIVAGTITGDKLVINAITAREIAAEAITAGAIKAGEIQAGAIATGAITAVKMAANSVTAASILAGTITATEIATDAITATKILAGAITAGKVAANAIVATNIAANQINAGHIVANSITAGQLAANTITAAQIAGGTITAGEIATGAITAVKVAANAIDASKIVAGSIDTAQLAASAITAVKIAANSIDASKIVAGSIDTLQLNAGAITAEKIATGAVTANAILAGSITAAKLVAGTITANELAAYAITGSKLALASSNFAYNPDMVQGTLGFTGSSTAGWTDGVFQLSPATGAPDGFTALMISGIGTPAAGEFSRVTHRRVVNAAGTLDRYQVTAGVLYEFSACLSARRCNGNVAAAFYDASGSSLGGWIAGTVISSSVTTGGSVAAFPKSTLITTAPAGAVSVMISFVATSIGQASPALYVSAPMYAAAVPGQTECSPYVDVSVTVMDGGNIRTKTIQADALVANSITAAQIAALAITADVIAASAITTAKIATNAVTANEILANSITTAKIATNAVTANEILGGTITATEIASNAITAVKIAASTITGAKIAGRTILATNLVAKSITAGEIAVNAITANEIASNTITAGEIAAGTITATQIAGRTITAGLIKAGEITANEIAANSITAGVIAAGAIGVAQLAAGAITTDKLGVGLNTGNLLFNSDFLNAFATWTQVGTGGVSWTTNYATGPTGLAVAMPTGTAVPALNSVAELRYRRILADGTSEEFLPVTQLKRYEFSTHLRNTVGHTVSMIIVPYDASGTVVTGTVSFVFGTDNLTRSLFSASLARIGGFFTVPAGATQVKVRLRIVYNGTGSVGNPFFTGVYAGLATANQTDFTDWTPMANTVIDGGTIATNSITATQIAASTITGDQIAGMTITGAKIVGGTITTTQLAASVLTADNITVGAGLLSNWVAGPTKTTIDGGKIEANSILTNTLKVGSRGISVRGIEFQAERNAAGALTGAVTWTGSGTIQWISDAGVATNTTLVTTGGAAASTTPYIYWIKGETNLRASSSISGILNNADAVMMCTFSPAAGIMPVFGGTIVDGTKITALSIAANQIAANAIQSDKIAANAILATHIKAGELTADMIYAGTISAAGNINLGSTNFQLSAALRRLSVVDQSGITRVQLGGLNSGLTSFGLILRDANNKIMLDSGGVAASAITGGIAESQLSGGGGFNQIYNPECAYGTSRVSVDTAVTVAQGGPMTLGTNNGSQYTLRGGYTNFCRADNVNVNFSSARIVTVALCPADYTRHQAESGRTYEFSAYVAGHRSRYRAVMIFCDGNDNALLNVDNNGGSFTTGRNNNLQYLSDYDRLSCIGIAPAGTANVYLILQFTGTGQPNPYLWWTRTFFGEGRPGQTEPSVWNGAGSASPTFIDTLVTNKISTNSLSALGASIGDLTAGILRAPNNKMIIDLNSGYIQIND